MLRLENLVKHYRFGTGEPIRAVDGIDTTVEAGEFVALFGPSGSGKTTLLGLIAGLLAPDSGRVLVNGQDVAAMSRRERDAYRLHQLGIVAQPENLIAGATALENASLRLVLTNVRRHRVAIEPLMTQLGLAARLDHRTDQLSMGERQRVAIARALATGPKLVLADEPTGNLDTRRTDEVLGLLHEICKRRGTAVLLATHDPRAARFADRVQELRDGRLRDYTPEETPAGRRAEG